MMTFYMTVGNHFAAHTLGAMKNAIKEVNHRLKEKRGFIPLQLIYPRKCRSFTLRILSTQCCSQLYPLSTLSGRFWVASFWTRLEPRRAPWQLRCSLLVGISSWQCPQTRRVCQQWSPAGFCTALDAAQWSLRKKLFSANGLPVAVWPLLSHWWWLSVDWQVHLFLVVMNRFFTLHCPLPGTCRS